MDEKSKLIADVWEALLALIRYKQEHGEPTKYDDIVNADLKMRAVMNELPDLRGVKVNGTLARDWLDYISLEQAERRKYMTILESQINMVQSSLPGEMWRQVEELPRYFVSNLGRVWSTHKRQGLVKPELKRCGLAVKRKNPAKWRYRVHLIGDDGKMRWRAVSRLVAIAFVPNPDNYPVVDHIDENPQNDRADNLRWCTMEQNNYYYAQNHYAEAVQGIPWSNLYGEKPYHQSPSFGDTQTSFEKLRNG